MRAQLDRQTGRSTQKSASLKPPFFILNRSLIRCSILFVSLLLPAVSNAQFGIFASKEVVENIGNEISGEIAAQTVRTLLDAQQIAAPQSYFHSIEYLENRAKELSLFHITLHEQPISRFEWEVRKAELWMLAPVTRKLADFRAVKSSLAAFSRSAHVMAELIDVGTGESDANYAGFDIAGKIVLASGKLEAVMRKAVWQFGALGVLSYHENSTADRGRSHSVQSWQTVPISDGNGKTGTFAFHIPAETALALKHLLASESESATLGRQKVRQQQTKVLLRADIDASVGDAGKSWSLSAEIPGEEILSENIVLSAVLPDNSTPPFHDLAGAAGLLEIARTLNRLINEGLLPVPRRTIKFWWIPDANTVTRTFINRPEAKDSILANLHLGAIGYDNEFSGGTRIWLSPKSNASYWNDVVE